MILYNSILAKTFLVKKSITSCFSDAVSPVTSIWQYLQTPFFIWLGSFGALWWYALFEETECLWLDEVVRKKNVTPFGMGWLNKYIIFRRLLWSNSLPRESIPLPFFFYNSNIGKMEIMDLLPMKVVYCLFCLWGASFFQWGERCTSFTRF